MKLTIHRSPDTKRFSVLTVSGLAEENALELTTGPNAVIITPARMTAMEMVNAIHALHEMTVEMTVSLAMACGNCDGCGMCECVGLESDDPVIIPSHVLEEAGLPTGCKLTACVGENGSILVEKAGYDYDLTDVPDHILEAFHEGGACLSNLEDKLMMDNVIYNAEKKEESPCSGEK